MDGPAVSTLAPGGRLRAERADSPTPGLVEGTEPGEVEPRSARFPLKS